MEELHIVQSLLSEERGPHEIASLCEYYVNYESSTGVCGDEGYLPQSSSIGPDLLLQGVRTELRPWKNADWTEVEFR